MLFTELIFIFQKHVQVSESNCEKAGVGKIITWRPAVLHLLPGGHLQSRLTELFSCPGWKGHGRWKSRLRFLWSLLFKGLLILKRKTLATAREHVFKLSVRCRWPEGTHIVTCLPECSLVGKVVGTTPEVGDFRDNQFKDMFKSVLFNREKRTGKDPKQSYSGYAAS